MECAFLKELGNKIFLGMLGVVVLHALEILPKLVYFGNVGGSCFFAGS